MAEELFRRQPLAGETRRRMDAAFPVFAGDGGQAPFGPSRFMLPADAGPFLRRYASTPVDSGDVWIVTLPKCGEWLVQEPAQSSLSELHIFRPFFFLSLSISISISISLSLSLSDSSLYYRPHPPPHPT